MDVPPVARRDGARRASTVRHALALLVLSLAVGPAHTGSGEDAARGAAEDLAAIERHWRRPVPPQGPPPAHFSPLEASLHPEACGTCHVAQLADWRTSLHARAMGPGVRGQVVGLIESDPATALECYRCHAPLTEQQELVPGAGGGHRRNPAFDGKLQAAGLTCSGCHVRGHRRFGPPRRDGAPAPVAPGVRLAHDGVTRTSAFRRAEFCKGCHQFPADGFTLNGKLLENTYEEWKASAFARQGIPCQDCHMPDRRHLWRGIHDPDMVRSGLAVTLATDRPRYRPGDQVAARLTLTSRRVGHAFPTYVTPRVLVRAELRDREGRPVPGSVEERTIGRTVTLDLAREVADTRIAPGGRFTLAYRRPVDRPGLRLRVVVTVEPDHFYTRFFEATLAGGGGPGAADLQEALAASRRSSFVLYEREVPVS